MDSKCSQCNRCHGYRPTEDPRSECECGDEWKYHMVNKKPINNEKITHKLSVNRYAKKMSPVSKYT